LKTCEAGSRRNADREPQESELAGRRLPQRGQTVQNQTAFSAGISRTQYYLSADDLRNIGDRLLVGSRALPALSAGGSSQGTASVTIPNGTPLGTYYFLACADDARAVPERDETNNCRTSATQIQVGRPDLVMAAVNNPPATAVRGTSIQVSETVWNKSSFNATATFRVQYYLSLDGLKNGGDRLLTGYRTVVGLAANVSLPATTLVTIPAATPAGDYFLLVCADDTFLVIESNETNNCLASTAKLTVTP
jgi:subtilase family serine protease